MKSSVIIGMCLYFCMGIWGCVSTSETRSEVYFPIFGKSTGVFRGINVGDGLEVARKKMGENPIYNDRMGLKYVLKEIGEVQTSVEFFADNLRTGKESNRITAISVSLKLKDEIQTTEVYEEILNQFVRKYGITGGNFGDFIWDSPSSRLKVYLKLSADRKSIFAFFIEKN